MPTDNTQLVIMKYFFKLKVTGQRDHVQYQIVLLVIYITFVKFIPCFEEDVFHYDKNDAACHKLIDINIIYYIESLPYFSVCPCD